MKSTFQRIGAIALLGLLIPLTAQADMPGRHPYYLHALSDLRTSRWLLDRRSGDPAANQNEILAIQEIDRAMGEIQHAAINDGKDLRDHEQGNFPNDRAGRMHQAIDLLHDAHNAIAREEDDPMTRGLQQRALMHIDEATRAAEHAMEDMHRY